MITINQHTTSTRIRIKPDNMRVTFPDGSVNCAGISVAIPTNLLPAFITLVSRGINTWDQAPQEIKDFVDEITGISKLLEPLIVSTKDTKQTVIDSNRDSEDIRSAYTCLYAHNRSYCQYPDCSCIKP